MSDSVTSGFSSVSNRLQGFTPLGEPQDESWFGLTRWQRMVGFVICMATGCIFFIVAFFTLPWLIIAPRKFATSFTLGSIMVMISFALYKGPQAHMAHLISRERLPFTITYLGSMILTLYFSLGLQSFFPTLIAAIVQVIALVWYLVSYLPGGHATLSYGTRALGRSVSNILPI
ncbi:Got1/Sft2-like family-domain-containing protein [Thamnocephalis sphaerospora]|uniref:Protein transport protein SFT2 n=1 Tax=Thamnocephalis sphaerospora TaxID=78915 RepID=A0A4P9XXB3_9FUNG|nr:Got1/Sft2-like family-domain-containing protein [Thamnocephalis sphaerospora]|eukprot:RKP10090.1 Got1/Sft2-like family-domain-containing protein [Thamnocephalis sphaerospora]